MKLWLDDLRPAPNTFGLVKSYEEFCNWIDTNGLPDFVSFDHDLGSGLTGYDCAKYLVNYCCKNKLQLPKYEVHSMNPVGKENIIGIFESYERFVTDVKN